MSQIAVVNLTRRLIKRGAQNIMRVSWMGAIMRPRGKYQPVAVFPLPVMAGDV